jgi:hypothetical protein
MLTSTCWLLSAAFWLLTAATPWAIFPAVAWGLTAACRGVDGGE